MAKKFYIYTADEMSKPYKCEGPFDNKDKAKQECKYLNMCDGYTQDDCIVPYYVVEETA
jgi:hypothetical protein